LRRDNEENPFDETLKSLELDRKVATIVGGFSAALGVGSALRSGRQRS
jgi:hypothetical protein